MTTQAPDRYRSGSGLPTWVKVVMALLAALVVGAIAVVGLFVWAFSGGWDGIRPAAHADDRRVVKARAASSGQLDAVTSAALQAVGPATETARVRVDLCLRGQNNWKVHDGYTLRCERRDGVVLAAEDLTQVARRADAALTAAGWRAAAGGGLTFAGEQQVGPVRVARYERPDRPGEVLEVGLASTAETPLGLELQYLPDVASVEGDLDAFTRAAHERRPRVVVLTTVPYFED